MTLVTRGLGGQSPGLVTFGLGGFTAYVEPPIVIPPTPGSGAGSGGGGASYDWTPRLRRRRKKRGAEAAFDCREDDETLIMVIDQFMKDLGNG